MTSITGTFEGDTSKIGAYRGARTAHGQFMLRRDPINANGSFSIWSNQEWASFQANIDHLAKENARKAGKP